MTQPSDPKPAGADSPDRADAADSPSRQPAARRLSDRIVEAPTLGFADAFSRPTLIRLGLLVGLLVALHYKLLVVLVLSWKDPNWTHGFIIPLFSIYLLYSRRDELYAVKRKPSLVGLFIMVVSIAAEVIAVFQVRNYWLAQMGMVGVVFGLLLYLGGWGVLRLTWLPVIFLIFALPIPSIIYSQLSLPLQNLAARGSVLILKLFQVNITSTASQLGLISQAGVQRQLTVAEACSGMRLLMAFVALGVAMAYLDYKPVWQRVVLVLAAVPIAVFCNVLRVTITCSMYYFDKPEFGQKFMHTFTGILMLIPAFLMLWALAWIIRNVFIEHPEEDEDTSEATS